MAGEDPVPRKDETENGQILKLILATQQGMNEKIVEIRIDLASMRAEVRQVQQTQADDKITRKERENVVHQDVLLTASGVESGALRNDQQHVDMWAAINTRALQTDVQKVGESVDKLTAWGRAIAITSSIVMTTLSIIIIIMEVTGR